ncbi:hypothetical protein RRG08_010271 [Elysia crispata]|uniref:Uncharacterized protein n=1 Tax=Elysia crispata TaxID=231223 RepID=A0AAE0Z481_9GAST|nr:hypothetical protein RRG08_010271 [Elysia crispata]
MDRVTVSTIQTTDAVVYGAGVGSVSVGRHGPHSKTDLMRMSGVKKCTPIYKLSPSPLTRISASRDVWFQHPQGGLNQSESRKARLSERTMGTYLAPFTQFRVSE